jgi:hypothetical protein
MLSGLVLDTRIRDRCVMHALPWWILLRSGSGFSDPVLGGVVLNGGHGHDLGVHAMPRWKVLHIRHIDAAVVLRRIVLLTWDWG